MSNSEISTADRIKGLVDRLTKLEETTFSPREVKGCTFFWVDEIADIQVSVHKLIREYPTLNFHVLLTRFEEVVTKFFRKVIPILESRAIIAEWKRDGYYEQFKK